ncbi:MAG: rhomboid family intramembrane serine protease [bacterium]|nr:rhomboid family intramembrane serine protease [bacterium]
MPLPSSPFQPAGAIDLLLSPTRDQAEARLLVLTSQGIRASIEGTPDGHRLVVARLEDEIRARESLELWVEENRPRPQPPEAHYEAPNRSGDLAGAYAIALALLGTHLALEHAGTMALAQRLGSANAWEILHGEIWRIVTALTLHSDLQHVLANTLIGGLFLASLAGRIGAGTALLAALSSGALGNLANAIHHQTGHNSIGASTAVFGVVGLLCGIEAWRRKRLALPWQGAWVPIGAGAALLAMLGAGGGDVDYGAHICGLVAGIALGWFGAPRWSAGPSGSCVQARHGAAALGMIALSWCAAWLDRGGTWHSN